MITYYETFIVSLPSHVYQPFFFFFILDIVVIIAEHCNSVPLTMALTFIQDHEKSGIVFMQFVGKLDMLVCISFILSDYCTKWSQFYMDL